MRRNSVVFFGNSGHRGGRMVVIAYNAVGCG